MPSTLFNPDDLHGTKIRRIPSAIVQFRLRITLCNIPIEPEFLNYLAERVIGILFEKARAGVPTGSAADAGRTINTDFHGYSVVIWSGLMVSAPGFFPMLLSMAGGTCH
jgi:hypothetical protein